MAGSRGFLFDPLPIGFPLVVEPERPPLLPATFLNLTGKMPSERWSDTALWMGEIQTQFFPAQQVTLALVFRSHR